VGHKKDMITVIFDWGKIRKESKLALILLLASCLRGAFHLFYFEWKWSEVLFDMYYLLVFYFSLLIGIEWIFLLFLNKSAKDRFSYYSDYAKYWLLLFPAVPFVTILTQSNYNNDVVWFKHIPTFFVQNNFLPTGMIFVIPLMLLFTLRHIERFFESTFLQRFLATALIFTITYLVYYQWLYGVQIKFRTLFSPDFAMAFYASILLILLIVIQYYLFLKKVLLSPYWLYATGIMLYLYLFIMGNRMFQYLSSQYI
jgi:hypothetical protein